MLSNTKEVQSIIGVSESEMTPKHALNMTRIRALVANSQNSTRESTDHMQFYLQQSGYIIDPLHALPVNDVFRDLTEREYDALMEILNGRYTAKWMKCEFKESVNSIYYLTSIRTNDSNSLGTLMVEMRSSYIEGILQPLLEAGDEWTAVYNGAMVYQSGPIPIELDWSQMSSGRGQFVVGDYMVSYDHSDMTDDLFVNLVSKTKLLAPLQSLRKLLYIVMLACFFASSILSYLLAVHNFKPLRKLVALTTDAQSEADEFVTLRQKLMEAADEKRRLLNRAYMDEQLKKDYYAYKELMEPDAWDKALFNPSGYCCLAEIVLVDYSEDCSPTEAMYKLREVFEYEPRASWQASIYQRGDKLMMLIHLEQASRIALNEVVDRLKTSIQCIRDNFAADCIVGFSAIKDSSQPSKALLQAMEMETHSVLQSDDSGESIRMYQANNNLELALKRLLADTVRDGDIGDALDSFSKEARRLLEKKENDEDGAEYGIKRQVIDIVNERYTDPSLNVSQIASQLGYSADYLSKMFRHTTLIGLLDYIHHTRVMAAKQLLLEKREMSIVRIGEAVGYVSVDSFIRAFKRIIGTTPGKYRENAIKSENADHIKRVL